MNFMPSDLLFLAFLTIITITYALLTILENKMRAENNPCYLPLKEVMADHDLYCKAKNGSRIIILRSKIEAFLISLPFLILFYLLFRFNLIGKIAGIFSTELQLHLEANIQSMSMVLSLVPLGIMSLFIVESCID